MTDFETGVMLQNKPGIVFVNAINITRPVYTGKHMHVQQQLYPQFAIFYVFLDSALCQQHLARIS